MAEDNVSAQEETNDTLLATGLNTETEQTDAPADADVDGNTEQPSDEPTGAPESYEDFTLPEGVDLNGELIEQFTPLAKDLNLTQEQAQKVVDLHTQQMTALAEQQTEAWNNTIDEWSTNAKADKEFGGRDFDANLSVARKAVEQFASKDFQEALNVTGMGNHPEMIRFMYRVGKLLAEDKIVLGNTAQEPKSLADRLYPTMQGDK